MTNFAIGSTKLPDGLIFYFAILPDGTHVSGVGGAGLFDIMDEFDKQIKDADQRKKVDEDLAWLEKLNERAGNWDRLQVSSDTQGTRTFYHQNIVLHTSSKSFATASQLETHFDEWCLSVTSTFGK